MIVIDIPDVEFFDSDSERFLVVPGGTYSFEHSLKAIAKWESFWKLPYLNTYSNFTREQTLSYYCCMCEDPTIDYRLITYDVEKVLIDRINDRATATTIQNDSEGPSRKVITSEEIYANMAMAQIPYSCEDWHFNRLLMTLSIIGAKHAPKKKMSREEIYAQNRAINEQRKRELNTKG